MNREQVVCSGCLEYMKTMPENSVDSIVTDPPYGLSFMNKEWDSFGTDTRQPGDEHYWVPDNPYGRSKARYGWNQDKSKLAASNRAFQESMTYVFEEALRVAKPGAHLLCFGGTRTFHRMACAIEDAGWEIRDCIMWVYGSGFPKSMDVAKAIDKTGGIDPKKSGSALMAARERAGMSRSEVADAIGCTEASLRDWEVGRAREKGAPVEHVTPSPIYRDELVGLLGFAEDERKVLGVAQDRRQDGSVLGLGHSGKRYDGAQTELARKWEGWGTCLKPAWEPIIVARKPLDGTVAHNVLTWGVGALNIDGCRVPTDGETPKGSGGRSSRLSGDTRSGKAAGMFAAGSGNGGNVTPATGRFPANLVHDGSQMVLDLFPDTGKSSGGGGVKAPGKNGIYGSYNGHEYPQQLGLGDSGSAARFFYCAKASKKERGEGNNHPTVKPIALMKWLVTLVTPKEGVVLDPFAGSGTTLVACKELGRSCIGIEREHEYVEIIKRRLGE